MIKILLITLLSTLLLTSCSNPDTSSGTDMEEQGGDGTESFPDGVCPDGNTQYKCGWISSSEGIEKSYYIKPGANLVGAKLLGANLTGANLADAYLMGLNLENVNLAGANLAGANLRSANLRNANLTGANLADGNLRDTRLPDANLSSANLSGANLEYADLNRVIANTSTTCPNGQPWVKPVWGGGNGNDCGF